MLLSLVIVFFFILHGSILLAFEDNLIWYYQGYTFNQKCNSFNEFFENYPLVPLKYHEYHTPYSYNIHNTTGILNLGYGVPCGFTRSGRVFFDSECNHNNVYPLGYIMYNPDVRFTDWYCLGEEPRIARYHASYATVTVYTNNNFYQDELIDIFRKITCSSICILGGQKVITDSSTNTTIIQSTPSVLCGHIITNLKDNNQPIEYTFNWIEAEPLPYTVVGATAIYSNGTLFVIGGIRGNYDRDTTNSILEADIDPNTCLPYNWRNYGYNDSSRIGNPKQYLNWTNPSVDSFPANVTFNNNTNYDILENRTLLWATEGPPALPKLSREYIYDNFPHIYPQSYYPTILTGGGITIPSILNLTPDNYTLMKFFNDYPNHDSYYIPLQPLDWRSLLNDTYSGYLSSSTPSSMISFSQRTIVQAFNFTRFPAVPVNLNLPVRFILNLDSVVILDRTQKYLAVKGEFLPVSMRKYNWYYNDGSYMYIMNSVGDILSTWEKQYNEVIIDYDTGLYSQMNVELPAGSNLLFSFTGNTEELFVIAFDAYLMVPLIGHSLRCKACVNGFSFVSQKCIHTPYEGKCSKCSVCSSSIFSDNTQIFSPSYLVSPCTREYDTKCIPCTICSGGPPLQACNATSNTVCNPVLEALVSQPKWKRIPISDTNDRYYGFIFITIITVWLLGCFLYSIHKTQLSTASTNVIGNDSFVDILRSSYYRRTFYASISTTGLFLFGNFTVFTYIYFTMCILSSVQQEESASRMNSIIDSSAYFMGKELRESTYLFCIVNVSFLTLSIIMNNGWLIYLFRYGCNKVPFLYYILLPYMGIHHRLVVWFYRFWLIPFENNHHHLYFYTQSLTVGEAFLTSVSIFCSDGIHLLTLLLFSDMYSATVSNARPVTIGVALCGLVNIILFIYRLFFVFVNSTNNKNILLSKDVEIIMKTTNHENNNPINLGIGKNSAESMVDKSTIITNGSSMVENILAPSVNSIRRVTNVSYPNNVSSASPVVDTSFAASTTVKPSIISKERINPLNDSSTNHVIGSVNSTAIAISHSSNIVVTPVQPSLRKNHHSSSIMKNNPPIMYTTAIPYNTNNIIPSTTKPITNILANLDNYPVNYSAKIDTDEDVFHGSSGSDSLLSPSLMVQESDSSSPSHHESSAVTTDRLLASEERYQRIRSQLAQINAANTTNIQTNYSNNVQNNIRISPGYFTYTVDNSSTPSVSSSSSSKQHGIEDDNIAINDTNSLVFDMGR